MVGYAPNDYRLWDEDTGQIVIARDVKFNENCFPWARSHHADEQLVAPIVYEQEGEKQMQIQETLDDVQIESTQADDQSSTEDCVCSEDALDAAEPDNHALLSHSDLGMSTGPSGEQSKRRSERERKFPGKYLNYLTGFSANAVGSPLSSDAPEMYNDIETCDDRDFWYRAVQDKLNSMKVNDVWKLTTCPAGVKPLKTKWVFRRKEDETGRQGGHNALLVVKGFLQRPGKDFEDTFAPVAKLCTVPVVLAVAVNNGFHVHQMDVKTACLHGLLKEDLYMEIPQGMKAKPGIV